MQEKTISQLIIFDDIAKNPIIVKADALFLRFPPNQSFITSSASPADYYAIQKEMLSLIGHEEVNADYWRNYVCGVIGSSDNVFSRMSENGVFDYIKDNSKIEGLFKVDNPSERKILEVVMEEVKVIRRIFDYDFESLARAIEAETKVVTGTETITSITVSIDKPSRRQHIFEAFNQDDDWTTVKMLVKYYRTHGAGFFESFDAFTWDGEFNGVKSVDPITMDDLIGYEHQKKQLIMNTEFLLRNLPCNNVLLYGDSGTGKSSSIKALLNQYKYKGLKLIALPKERIDELSKIFEAVAGRGLKFLIFIDDLSFEENDSSYKSFKSIIEGNINSRSSNAIICVTSNRRNIVKEVWKDRDTTDDVHLRDNLQEKRSLSDRFGLTIGYLAPDKNEYLKIVESLADKANIDLDKDKLYAQALTWEVRHGGRSGRTAKQFVDHLSGLIELNKELTGE